MSAGQDNNQELVQYCQSRVESTEQLEAGLAQAGYSIGLRQLEVLNWRDPKSMRREKSLVSLLQFVHSTLWKSLFGRAADGLERSTDSENEYYIYDKNPLTNLFVSVPKQLGQLNCASFIAGIINGVLDGAEFTAEVTAHFNTGDGGDGGQQTVFVVKVDREVAEREATLARR